jgi:hypothetical protein
VKLFSLRRHTIVPSALGRSLGRERSGNSAGNYTRGRGTKNRLFGADKGTGNGYPSLGPPDCQAEDRIAVLLDADVLFTLRLCRDSGTSSRSFGETCVQGVTRKEVMRAVEPERDGYRVDPAQMGNSLLRRNLEGLPLRQSISAKEGCSPSNKDSGNTLILHDSSLPEST